MGDGLLCPRGTKVPVDINHEWEHGPAEGRYKVHGSELVRMTSSELNQALFQRRFKQRTTRTLLETSDHAAINLDNAKIMEGNHEPYA